MSTVFREPISERSARAITATLRDLAGNAIDPGSVTAITVTLVDVISGEVVNDRQDQNCLNANGGTLGVGGAFRFVLSADDTIAIGTSRYQDRRLTFEVLYTDGEEHEQIRFTVDNLEDVA